MITHSGRIRFCALAIGVAFVSGACGTSTEPAEPGAPQTAGSADAPAITPRAAQDLCENLQKHVQDWHGKDTVLVKAQFNGVVQEWAARNNGINIAVARNRDVIDTTTSGTCPQVRTDILSTTGTTDLASALVGF
ncbi:hypothetical protein NONO_c43640 [Nocardia nova SH22a]|uniref:Lipoprotein n=1 Tax=Nocardia nova SH22a TaxID=1415166 RepID=W5TJI9_9NOCA|nr:hypothetical protein [Nocardia nova]AHH19148.1 hypothetical protein NONO_c43640 [Nocardia nova SH22a]